eukprot:CAMPEP_0201601360 /NCGR_PEP_ID=MMETSP0492-20130828/2338_1 /ASSEMBLY_ACC=CAM_ASM_000837 /TAXON_ID=420259 /ORGANISM="Thalassiosira gravida, Strain GMp14c1" /LENGTH=44 /DNA_ID= /DNA_START= /DNA_END= /DNA_ORIENTATION=
MYQTRDVVATTKEAVEQPTMLTLWALFLEADATFTLSGAPPTVP